MISNKVSFGKKDFKYFIGYKNDDKIKPLCITLPKMNGYPKGFAETKYMSFFEDGNLWKACNKLWNENSNIIQKGFDSEPVCDEKYLKTRINLIATK